MLSVSDAGVTLDCCLTLIVTSVNADTIARQRRYTPYSMSMNDVDINCDISQC